MRSHNWRKTLFVLCIFLGVKRSADDAHVRHLGGLNAFLRDAKLLDVGKGTNHIRRIGVFGGTD
jgi:hypothetical protein